ncbi:hypothetical protein SAMN04488117_11351 [Celeribacter baekdonensis]|uniref:Uncharacterized protein n=1 Tax=Celeribacter baekdonensis TaxID=875171 RepID=A0A1G7S1Y1_9RHOB|nr:hypothetical protein SAMN04488117_11351 [Celeribacter baekdonensis]
MRIFADSSFVRSEWQLRAASNLSTPIPYKNKNRASSLERRVFES